MVLENSSFPVSVPEMMKFVKANKTTIYRQMETLTTKGHISEVDLGDGTKRYELSTKGHHHHLVCMKCNSIAECDINDDFSEIEISIRKQKKFQILKHSLEFFGLCHNCT